MQILPILLIGIVCIIVWVVTAPGDEKKVLGQSVLSASPTSSPTPTVTPQFVK